MLRSLLLLGLVSAGTLTPAAGSAAEDAPPEILITRQLAEAEGLRPGDAVVLSTRPEGGVSRSFVVSGVYEPTPDPFRLTDPRLEARMHLPDLIELTRPETHDAAHWERVDAINVRLRDPASIDAFRRKLSRRLPGTLVGRTGGEPDGSNPFVVLERFHLAIALVTVLGSTAFLLALMIMRADERRETVGILRLIGVRKRRVLLEVFVEGLLIACAGAAFGVLLAVAVQDLANMYFQQRYDTTLVFVRVTLPIAVKCVALAVPLGVLASLIASWRILRHDILALIHR